MIDNKIILEISPTQIQKQIIDQNIDLGKRTYTNFLKKALKLEDITTFNNITNTTILNKVKELNPNIKKDKLFLINHEIECVKTCIKKHLQNTDTIENFSKTHLNQNSYILYNRKKSIKLNDSYIDIPEIGNISINNFNNIYKHQKLVLIKVFKENNIYKIDLRFKKYYDTNEMLEIINKRKPNFINIYSKISGNTNLENMNSFKINKKYANILKLKKLENLLKNKEIHSKSWYSILNRFHKIGAQIIHSEYVYN